MKTETEILERAIINLTIENAKIKEELNEKSSSSDFWYDLHSEKKEELEKIKEELEEIKTKLIIDSI